MYWFPSSILTQKLHAFFLGLSFLLMNTLTASHPSENDRPSLICFGDSITENGAWVDSPEAGGTWKLINAGRGGRQTSDIAAEFAPALAAHPEAQGVLILLGVNDLPARDPRSDEEKLNACLANLQGALDLALKRFPRESVFLGAPCGVDVTGLDSSILEKGYAITPPLLARLEIGIERLARTNGVSFFSLLGVVQPGQYSDGLHPNAEGDAEIAKAVGKALAGRAAQPLPAFYLVGDSISIDYHEALEQECRGHFRYSRKGGLELARSDLDHPQGANGGDSSSVLEHLRTILQSPAALPDTLVINCGLHDIKTDPVTGTRQVSLEAYRANLNAMVELIQGAGKRLIWITTTPVDEQRHNARSSFHRYEADLAAINAADVEVMESHGVAVIDLHAFSTKIGGKLFRDHVHFVPEVSKRQAEFIREELQRVW